MRQVEDYYYTLSNSGGIALFIGVYRNSRKSRVVEGVSPADMAFLFLTCHNYSDEEQLLFSNINKRITLFSGIWSVIYREGLTSHHSHNLHLSTHKCWSITLVCDIKSYTERPNYTRI